MLLAFCFIALGTVLLAIGSNVMVKGASNLALMLGVTPLVIGLTVVAFGTSSPELVISIRAALAGSSDVAVGNIVGSNIANVLLIVGLSSLISPMRVSLQILKIDVPIMIFASVAFWFAASDGVITRVESGLFLLALVGYVVMQVRLSRREGKSSQAEYVEEVDNILEKKTGPLVSAGLTAFGLLVLLGGAQLFLDGALTIARATGLSELIIGLTVVAVGTSLPEIATSVAASYRGNDDIALGNVVGSNILNLFGVLAICSLISPIAVPAQALVFDIPIMVASAIALAPIMFRGQEIARWEGALFLFCYASYLAYSI